MEHTPSPWEYWKSDKHYRNTTEYFIAPKGRLPTFACVYNYSEKTRKANAKLMTRAPVLLEACDRMRDALEQTIHICSTQTDTDIRDYMDDLLFGIEAIRSVKDNP